jgi:two-component system, NtrC family, sensor histidine kinase HydH
MRRIFRDVRLIVASVLILFAGITLLSYVIIAGEARRSRIITEYEAERIATTLAESLRAQGDGGISDLDPRILGFGLYGQDGALVAGYGSVPSTIAPSTAGLSFSYDDKAHKLFLTRQLGMGGMGGMGPGHMRTMRQRPDTPGRSGFLYLALDAGDFYRRRTLLRSTYFLIPLMAAGLMAAFLALFASNLRFRKNAEERETLTFLGESARTLAHEIRNPLGAIRIQTGLARQRLDGASWPELDAIDEETGRLDSLSRRVGDFLKDPAGHPEVLELSAFLDELAVRSPYHPRFLGDGHPASVAFDRELLLSVIENLLRNADESYDEAAEGPARSERAIELALSHGSGREANRAVIEVRDRGVGIPEATRKKIFDPFYTDKIHGSGIGLPLARRFVEAAGGTLSLSPREGGGTEVRIVLPLAEES